MRNSIAAMFSLVLLPEGGKGPGQLAERADGFTILHQYPLMARSASGSRSGDLFDLVRI